MLSCCWWSAFAQPVPAVPISGPWVAKPGFSFDAKSDKTRRSLSGIACALNAQSRRVCLVVFDEGAQARFIEVEDGGFTIDPKQVLLGAQDGELDAEAAATDGTYFYVAGSHSVKRQSCAPNPASQRVIRFRRDPATGKALPQPGAPTGVPAGYVESGQLMSIMASLPELKNHMKSCLGDGGINIEGMAVLAGRLHFGMRAPSIDGDALVVSVDAEKFFHGGDPGPRVSRVTLGKGRGIRDLTVVDGQVLILAGPDDADSNANVGWTVVAWDGQPAQPGSAKPRVLASLALGGVRLRQCDKELKPEALAVLTRDAQRQRVLVMSDGMCDGGGLVFDIAR
jgi:hypothetical protein